MSRIKIPIFGQIKTASPDTFRFVRIPQVSLFINQHITQIMPVSAP